MPKTCPKCGLTEPEVQFGKDRARPDGKTTHCKSCRRGQFARWYDANREEWQQHAREYQRRRRWTDATAREKGSVSTVWAGDAGCRITWSVDGWVIETLLRENDKERTIRKRTEKAPLHALLLWAARSVVYRDSQFPE